MPAEEIYAFWDADSGHVALLLPRTNAPGGQAAIFLELTDPAKDREFVGIFSTESPLAEEWIRLPHWALVRVPVDARSFAIELVPVGPDWRLGELRLDFERSITPDLDAHDDEVRYYGFYAEVEAGQRSRSDKYRVLDIPPAGFVESTDSPARNRDHFRDTLRKRDVPWNLLQFFQYAVRDHRIGPTRTSNIDHAADEFDVCGHCPTHSHDARQVDRPASAEDRATGAFQELFLQGPGHQPSLELRLGHGEGMEELARRVMFLHIPANMIAALEQIDVENRRKKRILSDLLRHVVGGEQSTIVDFCGADVGEAVWDQEHGWVIRWDFSGVAMGDIVGVVARRTVLTYRSGEMAGTAGSRLFLRYLIDDMKVIDAEVIKQSDRLNKLINQVIGNLERNRGQQLRPEPRRPAAGRPRAACLADRLWDALGPAVREFGDQIAGARLGRLLRQEEFKLRPTLLSTLVNSEDLRRRLRHNVRQLRKDETDFLLSAMLLSGHSERVIEWARSHPTAELRLLIWQALNDHDKLLELLPELGVVIPEGHDQGALAAVDDVLVDLERGEGRAAADVFRDMGNSAAAKSLLELADSVAGRRDAPTFERLLEGAVLIAQAEEQRQADAAGVKRIVERLDMDDHLAAPNVASGASVGELRQQAETIISGLPLEREDREGALAEMRLLRLGSEIARLVHLLERGRGASTAKGLVLKVAQEVRSWASNADLDRLASVDANVFPGAGNELDWETLQPLLKQPDCVPRSLLSDLAEARTDDGGGAGREVLGEVAPVARALRELVGDVRAKVSDQSSAGQQPKAVDDQIRALEAYCTVALTTCVVRRLNVLAVEARSGLGKVELAPAAAGELVRSWNDFGRMLAPERALTHLPLGLQHFDDFRAKAARFLDPDDENPTLLRLALEEPPRLSAILQALE